MKTPDKPNSVRDRATHGPSSKRLSRERREELVERLTGDDEVRFREADTPLSEDEEPSEEVEELLE